MIYAKTNNRRYFMQDVIDRFKAAHLWVGNITIDEMEYLKYFEQDELEDDEYCKFAQDMGLDEEECDEDYIIIFPLLEKSVSVEELFLAEVPFENKNEMEKAKKICSEKGIEKINTFVFYSDPTLVFEKNKNFNGLTYIGEFLAEHEA